MTIKLEKSWIQQILYIFSVSIFLITKFIRMTCFSTFFSPRFDDCASYCVLLFALFSFYGRFRYKKTIFIVSTFLVGISILIYIRSSLSSLMVLLILIATAYKMDIKLILKIQMLIVALSIAIVILCSSTGIIPNLVFVKDENYIYAMGFLNYATISYLTFGLNIIFFYTYQLNKRNLIIALLVDTVIFLIFHNRLMYAVELIYFVLILATNKINMHKMRRLIIAFPWIACFFSYILAKSYERTNPIMYELNLILSGRLYYGNNALKSISIDLFGKYIAMRGNIPIKEQSDLPYFYIDSGFLFSILSNGVIFTLIILIMYSIILHYALLKKNNLLVVTVVIISIANMINNIWVTLIYCPFILFFSEALEMEIEYMKRRKKHIRFGEVYATK